MNRETAAQSVNGTAGGEVAHFARLAAMVFAPPTRPVTYNGYNVWIDPPPIPVRDFDWEFAHEDYDGAPDSGDVRCGRASSLADAVAQIDAIESERGEGVKAETI